MLLLQVCHILAFTWFYIYKIADIDYDTAAQVTGAILGGFAGGHGYRERAKRSRATNPEWGADGYGAHS